MSRLLLVLALAPAAALAGDPAPAQPAQPAALTFDAVPITTTTPKPSVEIVLTRQDMRAAYDARLRDGLTERILAKHEGGTEEEAEAEAAKPR